MAHWNRTAGHAAVLAAGMLLVSDGVVFAQDMELRHGGPKTEVSVVVGHGFRAVDVTIKNRSGSSRTFSIAGSTWFQSFDGSTKYQDLAVVFPIRVKVMAAETKQVRVKTACKQADRAPPPTGLVMKLGKPTATDKKFGHLIAGYHAPILHGMIAASTGSRHHATSEKKQEFLQLMTWIYYGSKRPHMVQFATKHIFKGNKARAKLLVKTLYPLAKKAIELYKATPALP